MSVSAHQLVSACAQQDRSAFEAAARRLGMGFLDALVQSLPVERVRDLQAELRRLSSDASSSRELRERFVAAQEELCALLSEQGAPALWVVLDWCRARIRGLPDYGGGFPYLGCEIVFLWELARSVHRDRVELSWLSVELLADIPSSKKALADHAPWRPWDPEETAAVEHALYAWRISQRRRLADWLHRAGRLDVDWALANFVDAPLRDICERVLEPQVAEVVDRLRPLAEHRSSSVREAALRLVRKLDAVAEPARGNKPRVVSELEARLRANTCDAETSRVWADALSETGDPRGELVALEHAILDEVDPARQLELSQKQAELCREHRKRIWKQPGGFPYRESFRGRSRIRFVSEWSHRMRGRPGLPMLERIESFMRSLTTSTGWSDARETLERTGRATVSHSGFQLTHPNSAVPLPHQEGEHYADGVALACSLKLDLVERYLRLDLELPFEEFDERFVAYYDAICERLGKVFTPSGFSFVTPSADGKRMKAKKARFRRG